MELVFFQTSVMMVTTKVQPSTLKAEIQHGHTWLLSYCTVLFSRGFQCSLQICHCCTHWKSKIRFSRIIIQYLSGNSKWHSDLHNDKYMGKKIPEKRGKTKNVAWWEWKGKHNIVGAKAPWQQKRWLFKEVRNWWCGLDSAKINTMFLF